MNIDKYKLEQYYNNINNSNDSNDTLIITTTLTRKKLDSVNSPDYIYYYTFNDTMNDASTIEFMYCKSAYAAYINRIIDF